MEPDFILQIQGNVDPMDKTKHAAIQAIGQAVVDQLAKLGATITVSSVSTPSGATTPVPTTPQPQS